MNAIAASTGAPTLGTDTIDTTTTDADHTSTRTIGSRARDFILDNRTEATFKVAVKATQLVIVGTAAVTLCMVALTALMAWVAAQLFSVVWNVNGLVLGTGYVHVRGNVLVWCGHTIARTAGVYRSTNTAAQWVTTTTYLGLRQALA